MGGEPTDTPLLRRATNSGDRAIQATAEKVGASGLHRAGGGTEMKGPTHLNVIYIGIINQNMHSFTVCLKIIIPVPALVPLFIGEVFRAQQSVETLIFSLFLG